MPPSMDDGLADWRAWAEGCEHWSPPRGPVCVVAPHPDDETLGAGGLIFECRRRGQPVTVVSVTDGEASHPDWPELATVRRGELRRALRILGGEAIGHERLGLPDGEVRASVARVRSALRTLTREVVLVAPYEHDGHPDHEAVAEACAEVAAERRMPLVRYVIWGWLSLTPESRRRLPCRRLDLGVAARRAKTDALGCFTSQLSEQRGAPIVPPGLLAYFGAPYELFLT